MNKFIFSQAINPKRFDNLLASTNEDIWLTHVLDRIIYRCQNSNNPYFNNKKQCFTEPLDALCGFVGATSIRTLQTALSKLEQLGWIRRQATPDEAGKKCHIWLTDDLLAHLPQLPASANAPQFHQAENIDRFDALLRLCQKQGSAGVVLAYVLDRFIYRTQNSNRSDDEGNRYFVFALEKLAANCHISVSTLQRQINMLVKLGLVIKTKVRLLGYRVETRYSIAPVVWSDLQVADMATMQRRIEHQQQAALDEADASPVQESEEANPTHEGIDQFRHEETDHNINKNYINKFFVFFWIYNNILKYNITACVRKQQPAIVKRETLEIQHTESIVNFEDKSEREHKANPQHVSKTTQSLPSFTTGKQLNDWQQRFIAGMLNQLATKHEVKISDPTGLTNEIYFALTSPYFFPKCSNFKHRVNIVSKLLRQKRWTTPYGFERYDPTGQQQKTKRDAREQEWEACKQQEAQVFSSTCQVEYGTKSMGELLATKLGLFSAEPSSTQTNACPSKLSKNASTQQGRADIDIAEQYQRIEQLRKRQEEPDCNATLRQQIEDVIAVHRGRIQHLVCKQGRRDNCLIAC